MSEATRGRSLVLGAALLWSLGGMLIRQASQWGAEPQSIACLRSAFAAAALAWALPAARPAIGWRAGIAAALFSALLVTFVAATVLTSAAHAIFLQYFSPLLVAVGAKVLYREAVPRRGVAALAIGTAGIIVIVGASIGRIDTIGLALGLVSAVFFASFVLVQRGLKAGSPIGLTCAYNLAAAAVLLPFAAGHLHMEWRAWLLIAGTGVVQIGVPYVLFLYGLRLIPANEAGILMLLEPVLNPLWAWWILGEGVAFPTALGGCLILGAVGLHVMRPPGKRELISSRSRP
ncbi:MAG: DMT family transporter [Planctomycetes bacterium]|nr:DMT family transporter [Planctomycetota bacterium]